MLGMEKLEWCGYPIKTDRQTDRQTDEHRTTAQAALMHSIVRQKLNSTSRHVSRDSDMSQESRFLTAHQHKNRPFIAFMQDRLKSSYNGH